MSKTPEGERHFKQNDLHLYLKRHCRLEFSVSAGANQPPGFSVYEISALNGLM